MDPNQLIVQMLEQNTQSMNDRFDGVDDAIAGVHHRLDMLNSRTRKNEVSIARLKVIVGGACAIAGSALAAYFTHLFGG